ncbi:DNA replication protein DnaD [Bacillaceae bacterium]
MEPGFTRFLQEGFTSFSNLLLKYYKKLGLNDGQMMLLLHILAFKGEGKEFPTVAELEERMSAEPAEVVSMLQHLVKNGFLAIEEHVDPFTGVRSEAYSLEPFYRKIGARLAEEFPPPRKGAAAEKGEDSLYTLFEEEFGRPLSPMECETLASWEEQDGYSKELIKAALKEAVISGKPSFKYIDRILLEWQRNNIRTAQEAREYSLRFRKYQQRKDWKRQAGGNEEAAPFPFYNWLEEENR